MLIDLLKSGYHVRGTVRSQKKADFIINKYGVDRKAYSNLFSSGRHAQYKDKLEVVVVEDISVPHAFHSLVKGTQFVLLSTLFCFI